jgi:hypothetical protein
VTAPALRCVKSNILKTLLALLLQAFTPPATSEMLAFKGTLLTDVARLDDTYQLGKCTASPEGYAIARCGTSAVIPSVEQSPSSLVMTLLVTAAVLCSL